MKRPSIEAVVGVVGGLWLASVAIEFLSVADLLPIGWRIGAIVMDVAVFIILGAMVLVTNTRRPYGIDPNKKPRDPFGETTEELWQAGVSSERRKQPRRAIDQANAETARRLIKKLEADELTRPLLEKTPQWALDLQANNEAMQQRHEESEES